MGYRENTPDPSVFIKFQVDTAASTGSAEVIEKLGAANTDVFLLAWTTTPWTLTSNVAVAVNVNLDYVKLKAADGSIYYFVKENLFLGVDRFYMIDLIT